MKRNALVFGVCILGGYAFLLSLAAIFAPYLLSKSVTGISSLLYSSLSTHCHQIPHRSLWVFGSPMGLCSRCFSSYLAFALATFLLFFVRESTKYWKAGFLMMIPLLLDGFIQVSGLRASTNSLRIVTGILAGAGVALASRKIVCMVSEWVILRLGDIKCPRKGYSFVLCFILIVFSSGLIYFSSWVYSETAGEITLKQYTPVILILRENVSSKDKKPGDNVQLAVLEDVNVDRITLIKAGTPVIGKVTVAEQAAYFGEPGQIAIVPLHVEAVDGQKVRLGGTLYARGEDKEVSTAVLGSICLPLALRGGGQATITDGTELKAYVERDYKIRVGD